MVESERSRASRASGDISQMAVSIFEKVRTIKRSNPGVASAIDRLEAEIRDRLAAIRKLISRLDKRDRDLVTILVINGFHRTADEVLVDHK